jgi:hypothetical protein
MNTGADVHLKMKGMGRDCYGGRASFYYQDIYEIDFTRKKMPLTESIFVEL